MNIPCPNWDYCDGEIATRATWDTDLSACWLREVVCVSQSCDCALSAEQYRAFIDETIAYEEACMWGAG